MHPTAQHPSPDVDVSVVLRARDDEERLGPVLARICRHLANLNLKFEVLVADEGSGDNTVAVAVLMKPRWPEVEVLHAAPGHGYSEGCRRARGRALLFFDAHCEAPLAQLGYALEQLRAGSDVVAVSGRYLVLRRVRALQAADVVLSSRDPRVLERRLLRRARALRLMTSVAKLDRERRSLWGALRQTLLGPAH